MLLLLLLAVLWGMCIYENTRQVVMKQNKGSSQYTKWM
jgi:hypothetical protein